MGQVGSDREDEPGGYQRVISLVMFNQVQVRRGIHHAGVQAVVSSGTTGETGSATMAPQSSLCS